VVGEEKWIGRAYVTMVALDDLGKPTAVPPLIVETKQEKRRFEQAKERRDFRLKLRQKNGK
jgi:acyl-CoA hydrolase